MKTWHRISSRFLWLLIPAALVFACSNDPLTTDEEARNVVSGVADGVAFETTGFFALKDSADNFLMAGNFPGNGSLLAGFSGRVETEYPIATSGGLPSLAVYLDELIGADSFYIDTIALQEIFTDSVQFLPAGSSFLFYTRDSSTWFSRRGSITLSTFDPTINRLYGTIEAEFANTLSGPIYINAAFEDILFYDCAGFSDCGL